MCVRPSLALFVLLGCSSGAGSGYTPTDAGGTSESGAGGGGSGGAARLDASSDAIGGCNALESLAPEIHETVVADPQPTPQGGTVEPGLYFETEFKRYESKAIPADAGVVDLHRLTAQIDADLTMAVTVRAMDTGLETRYLFRLEPRAGGVLRYQFLCPSQASTDYGYDVSPGKIVIYYTDRWGPFGYTMTKQ